MLGPLFLPFALMVTLTFTLGILLGQIEPIPYTANLSPSGTFLRQGYQNEVALKLSMGALS